MILIKGVLVKTLYFLLIRPTVWWLDFGYNQYGFAFLEWLCRKMPSRIEFWALISDSASNLNKKLHDELILWLRKKQHFHRVFVEDEYVSGYEFLISRRKGIPPDPANLEFWDRIAITIPDRLMRQ